MRITLSLVWSGMLWLCAVVPGLRADVLEMQNGDRYFGRVLTVSTDAVVLNSEVLGKVTVPRGQVASLTFGVAGTNAVAAMSAGDIARPVPPPVATKVATKVATNLPPAAKPIVVVNTNAGANLSAAFQQLGANTNFISQTRQQMLGGNPEAGEKYDQMVQGLLGGQLDMNGLRRQAQDSAEQLRELKRELGPEADEALDGYLKILNDFVNETADPANPVPPSK